MTRGCSPKGTAPKIKDTLMDVDAGNDAALPAECHEPQEYKALSDVDLGEICAITPDDQESEASFEVDVEGEMAETQGAWDAIQNEFMKKVDNDPNVVNDWLPNGIDFSFTGRQLNAMSISREFLEYQLEDLILARNELLAHLKRSLKIRRDMEKAYYSVQNARFYERKDSQLTKILE